MSPELFKILIITLPVIAFLYASVGHGGASSYIALMTLLNLPISQVKTTSLLLNIIVSGLSFFFYRKSVQFPWKLFFKLALFSVPASFLGGLIHVEVNLYRNILGYVLIFPIARLLNIIPINKKLIINSNWTLITFIGITIGFISGLIGIGGGIILSPVLLLLGWTNLKETSAVSALFIFVNSIAGILAKPESLFQFLPPQFLYLIPITALAGAFGGLMGSKKFNLPTLKYLLIIVLCIASYKLIFA